MKIDYSPLWRTMELRNVNQSVLLRNGIDFRTLDQLRHDRNITIKTLGKLCKILECSPNDIVRFIEDTN